MGDVVPGEVPRASIPSCEERKGAGKSLGPSQLLLSLLHQICLPLPSMASNQVMASDQRGMLRQMRFRVPSMAGDQGGVLRQMRFRSPSSSMASDQPGMLHARSACSLHAPCPSKHPSTPLLMPVSPPVSHRHPCHANSHHPTPAIPTATILASAVSTATLPSRTCSSVWW